jgi:hypothetical protein
MPLGRSTRNGKARLSRFNDAEQRDARLVDNDLSANAAPPIRNAKIVAMQRFR